MTDYERLIKKYDNDYVPGEKRSLEYDNKIKRKEKLKNRMLIVDELSLEAKFLLLSDAQKETVKHLVSIFNQDFKSLHRRASDETIILSFIFYVKKLDTPKIQLKNYAISKKYNLSDAVFELILCRITDYFMSNSPLVLKPSRIDNHETLVKTGDYS